MYTVTQKRMSTFAKVIAKIKVEPFLRHGVYHHHIPIYGQTKQKSRRIYNNVTAKIDQT